MIIFSTLLSRPMPDSEESTFYTNFDVMKDEGLNYTPYCRFISFCLKGIYKKNNKN